MNYLKKTYTLCCLFFVIILQSFASEVTVNITNEKQIYNLSQFTYCFVDSSNIYTIDQVMCELCPIHFLKNKNNELHNPHNNLTYWYRINVENKLITNKNLVLEFANSTIPFIKVYIKREHSLFEYRNTGSSLPYNTRDIESPSFCYQLSLLPFERVSIYAQILPQGDALNTPVILYDAMSFNQKTNNLALMNGIYYGLMFLTIALSFILIISFTTISEKTNYVFLGILMFFSLWNADLDGIAFQFLWPSNPMFSTICMYSLPLFGIIFMSLFNDEIRENNFFTLMMYYVKMIFALVILLFVVYTLIFSVKLIYIHGIGLILGLIMLILTFISWFNYIKIQPRAAKYFISLFTTILAWLIIITLKIFTKILPNEFYVYSFKIFLGIQAVILTLAVVSKMRIKFSEVYYESIIKLDKEVAEKDEEINNRKKEIMSINKDMSIINKLLQKQNKDLKLKNDQLLTGINYAQNIQQAILPNISANSKFSKQIFALYKPKEQLSGDIFYVNQFEDILYIGVIDCTGHGIPGAFLSIIAYNILHAIIIEKKIIETDILIHDFQKEIFEIFKNNNNDFFSYDAIEIGLLTINVKTDFMCYAGSKIPAIIFNKDGIVELKGDVTTVNDSKDKREHQLNSNSLKLQKGDMIYLFTNGYSSQFNNKTERFMKKNLKLIFSQIYTNPVTMQRNDLEKRFNEWKGDVDQTDDVLIVGVKI